MKREYEVLVKLPSGEGIVKSVEAEDIAIVSGGVLVFKNSVGRIVGAHNNWDSVQEVE